MGQADSPDITVVITVHDETRHLVPMFASVGAALMAATEAGYGYEVIVVQDRVHPRTAELVQLLTPEKWLRVATDFGDMGPSRNWGVTLSRGWLVSFVDGDDLVSANWLVKSIVKAEQCREPAVFHPELNWIFGPGTDGSVLALPRNMDSRLSRLSLLMANQFDSMFTASREILLEFPFHGRDLEAGWAWQDWSFNHLSLSAGVPHLTVPGTVVFKRRRGGSLSATSRSVGCLFRKTDYFTKVLNEWGVGN